MTEDRAPYPTNDKPQQFMLAIGSAWDGMQLIGPFDSAEEAEDFADSNTSCNWEIVPITPRAELYGLTPTRRAAFDMLTQMGYTPERLRGWRLYWTADGEEIDPKTLKDDAAVYWRELTR